MKFNIITYAINLELFHFIGVEGESMIGKPLNTPNGKQPDWVKCATCAAKIGGKKHLLQNIITDNQ
jgi:hypothetical protein